MYIRTVKQGNISNKFLFLKSPNNATAQGITDCILSGLAEYGVTEKELRKKMVAMGCDGASVMVGKTGCG